jgi:hypothetical protein
MMKPAEDGRRYDAASVAILGRPPRERDFQRQYRRKPARCQRTRVSGRDGLEDRWKSSIQLYQKQAIPICELHATAHASVATRSADAGAQHFLLQVGDFDLNGEASSVNKKHSSATIVAVVKRSCHQIKRTKFYTHPPTHRCPMDAKSKQEILRGAS